MKTWKCTYIAIRWAPKSSMQLIRVMVSRHLSQDHALGYAYNQYNLSYLSKNSKLAKSRVLWYGNPAYGRALYKLAVVEEMADDTSISSGIDISNQHTRRQLLYLLQEMRDEWFDRTTPSRKNKYQDHSLELSRLAWSTTIPEGWRLVREGTTIKKTDKEFGDSTCTPNHWGSVAWYNVGKRTTKSSSIGFVDETGKTYKTIPAHIDPLIIRQNRTPQALGLSSSRLSKTEL